MKLILDGTKNDLLLFSHDTNELEYEHEITLNSDEEHFAQLSDYLITCYIDEKIDIKVFTQLLRSVKEDVMYLYGLDEYIKISQLIGQEKIILLKKMLDMEGLCTDCLIFEWPIDMSLEKLSKMHEYLDDLAEVFAYSLDINDFIERWYINLGPEQKLAIQQNMGNRAEI